MCGEAQAGEGSIQDWGWCLTLAERRLEAASGVCGYMFAVEMFGFADSNEDEDDDTGA